ncbi:MAG: LemA family protein, partial [Dethiobacteria bacterium]|nr:LemA family protein [Dethiobacteria bacterium]
MVWAIVGIIALIVVSLISIYNRLVTLRQRIKNAWAQIEVQLKRRYDLIPNLVNTVKGYATHEQDTFTKVTEARNMAIQAKDVGEQAGAENMLSGALKTLFAV